MLVEKKEAEEGSCSMLAVVVDIGCLATAHRSSNIIQVERNCNQ